MTRFLIAVNLGMLWPYALTKIPIPSRTSKETLNFVKPYFLLLSTLGAISALIGPSVLSVIGAVLWSATCIVVAFFYFHRYLTRATRNSIETAADLAPAFVAFGSIWLVAANSNYNLFGFDSTVVLLTAAHFHAAGGCLTILSALNGRLNNTFINRFICGLVVVGIPSTAIGISIGGSADGIGATPTIIAGVLLAISQVIYLKQFNAKQKVFRIASSSCLLFAMLLAFLYSLQHYGIPINLTIDDMVHWHASFNTFGFIGFGFVSYLFMKPDCLAEAKGIPTAQLVGKGIIGPNFFENSDAVDETHKPTGLIDSIDQFDSPLLDTVLLADGVIHFYENTQNYDLLVSPKWNPSFKPLYFFYRQGASHRQQTDLPILSDSFDGRITNKILGLREDVIGRSDPHAWVRTYHDKKLRTLFAAIYSRHEYSGITYMDISFPMWRGGLTSVLRLENISSEKGSGLLLTTAGNASHGDAGIFFATKKYTYRLPLTEWIWVWRNDDPSVPTELRTQPSETVAVARHELHMFGIRYLTLDYFIVPSI